MKPQEEFETTAYDSSFQVFDSKNYHVVTTFDTKRDMLSFCVDHRDRHICTVESSRNREDESNVCRVYEIGRIRGENEEQSDDGMIFIKNGIKLNPYF